MRLKQFVEQYGNPFSELLGIDLRSRRPEELSKWFLASILYSKPIRESTATLTYQTFELDGVVTPSKVVETGWEGLVSLLDEGGYTRYDFSTATKLLEVFGNLQKKYGGDLDRLHDAASDSADLERRIKGLGRGIGATTISVFLRDMRPIWRKANPRPSPLVSTAMTALGIGDIAGLARRKRIDPVRLETALLRLGKDYIRRGRSIDISLS